MSSQRPRVAFLGYAHDARGGIAQFGRSLAESVGERADVRLIGYRRIYPRFTRPGRQAPDPSVRAGGITGPKIPVPWEPWTWRRTADDVAAFAPQLLVVQWWTPLLGPSVRAILGRAHRDGIRTLVMCHNHRPHEPFPFWRPISAAALRRADAYAAFTPVVADGVRALVGSVDVAVHPLPEPIPTAAAGGFDWEARLGAANGPVALFFGNVRAYKGLDDLLAAWPLVRRELDATLVVAGTFFEPLERFERQARELGIADGVRFVPEYIPDEDIPGLFGRADILVMPYRAATASGQIGQAAVAGVPIVATAVGGLPGLLGDTGVLVPPGDRDALAQGIVRALRERPAPPPLDRGLWHRWRDVVLDEAARA